METIIIRLAVGVLECWGKKEAKRDRNVCVVCRKKCKPRWRARNVVSPTHYRIFIHIFLAYKSNKLTILGCCDIGEKQTLSCLARPRNYKWGKRKEQSTDSNILHVSVLQRAAWQRDLGGEISHKLYFDVIDALSCGYPNPNGENRFNTPTFSAPTLQKNIRRLRRRRGKSGLERSVQGGVRDIYHSHIATAAPTCTSISLREEKKRSGMKTAKRKNLLSFSCIL